MKLNYWCNACYPDVFNTVKFSPKLATHIAKKLTRKQVSIQLMKTNELQDFYRVHGESSLPEGTKIEAFVDLHRKIIWIAVPTAQLLRKYYGSCPTIVNKNSFLWANFFHELAHIVDPDRYGPAHSNEWRNIMKSLIRKFMNDPEKYIR